MAKRKTAPRKKKLITAVPNEQRGSRFACPQALCNVQKYNAVARLLDQVLTLKQAMSVGCRRDILAILHQPYVYKSDYKNYPNDVLNAWETQALFHDIVGDYQRSLDHQFQNQPFVLQSSFTTGRYLRAMTLKGAHHAKGELKERSLQIQTRQTVLTQVSNYLLRCNLATFEVSSVKDAALRNAMLILQTDKGEVWVRLLRVVRQRQARLAARVKEIYYTTGTHRRHPRESGSKVVFDAENTEYQYWLQVRLGNKRTRQADGKLGHDYARLPLLFNKARLHPEDVDLDKEFRLKAGRRKILVCVTFEAEAPVFKPQSVTVGADVNTKNNLVADSLDNTWDYNRTWLAAVVTLLEKLDKAKATHPDQQLTYRERARMTGLLRANEGELKRLIAGILDDWEAQDVTDIVLEDLSLARDATFLRHPEFDIKYSRLTRLLRLSNLKDWLASQGEKRGIRVHTTHAAYSSQECPRCHHVSQANRVTQETFKCEACGFTHPADNTAGLNLENRILSDVLRESLHTFDKYGRASPRPMKRARVKEILLSQKVAASPSGDVAATAGQVTDLLGPALTTKVPVAALPACRSPHHVL